jgi:hypothetical protein
MTSADLVPYIASSTAHLSMLGEPFLTLAEEGWTGHWYCFEIDNDPRLAWCVPARDRQQAEEVVRAALGGDTLQDVIDFGLTLAGLLPLLAGARELDAEAARAWLSGV